jgi:hypothetical protein
MLLGISLKVCFEETNWGLANCTNKNYNKTFLLSPSQALSFSQNRFYIKWHILFSYFDWTVCAWIQWYFKSLKFKCPQMHDHNEFKNPFWQTFVTNKLILQSWKKTNENENEFSFMESIRLWEFGSNAKVFTKMNSWIHTVIEN